MKQLIVVLTDEFSSVNGMLYAFDETGKEPSLTFPIVVGKQGMAWGRGLHNYWLLPGQHKKEGDEKAPAGLFYISSLFGQTQLEKTKMPFLEITKSHICVDDPASEYYNVMMDENEVLKDWSSAEKMAHHYQLGVVIDHNADPVTPGMGSCIFMHRWSKPNCGTKGCTAMSEENMVQLAQWLDVEKEPHLVQIPREGYSSFLSSLRVEPSKTAVTKRLGMLIKA